MIRRPPRSTRSDTPFPYSTLCRSRRTARIVALHRGDVLVPAGELRRVLVQHGLHPLEEHPVHVTHVAGIFEWRPHAGRGALRDVGAPERSEEHTSELQSLMRISYAVFRLKNKNNKTSNTTHQ